MSWIELGPWLSLDNLLAALALAPHCRSRAAFGRLIAWFAGVEAVAPVVGSMLHVSAPAMGWAALGPSALLVTLGFAVLGAAAFRRRRPAAEPAGLANPAWWASGGWPTGLLAVVLGLDNLLAGAAMPLPQAAGCGLLSGATVLAAGLVAWTLGRRAPPAIRTVAAGALLIAAGVAGLA